MRFQQRKSTGISRYKKEKIMPLSQLSICFLAVSLPQVLLLQKQDIDENRNYPQFEKSVDVRGNDDPFRLPEHGQDLLDDIHNNRQKQKLPGDEVDFLILRAHHKELDE